MKYQRCIVEGGAARWDALRALSHRNYRLFFAGQVSGDPPTFAFNTAMSNTALPPL